MDEIVKYCPFCGSEKIVELKTGFYNCSNCDGSFDLYNPSKKIPSNGLYNDNLLDGMDKIVKKYGLNSIQVTQGPDGILDKVTITSPRSKNKDEKLKESIKKDLKEITGSLIRRGI